MSKAKMSKAKMSKAKMSKAKMSKVNIQKSKSRKPKCRVSFSLHPLLMYMGMYICTHWASFMWPIAEKLAFASGNLFTRNYPFMSLCLLQAGTDVIITIFCDFWQFSAKKLAFFSKTNDMIKFF
jgi:hypothetical protein